MTSEADTRDVEERWLGCRKQALDAINAALTALEHNPDNAALRAVAQAAIDRYRALKQHG